MVEHDRDGQDRRRSRGWAVALTLIAAGTLAAMVVMLHDQPLSVRTVLDADDDAFFGSSESVANVGDQDMRRSGRALKKGDLSEAFSLAKKAASEYSQSLSENRLDAAEKVESQVKAAIAAKHAANEDMIQGVLAEAQKVRAKAEASAAHEQTSLQKVVAGAPSTLQAEQKGQSLLRSAHHDFSLAKQAHLLYKDEKLLNVHAAKLPALAETDPADDPSKPVPKVLDCGPLSNDCNLNQGGEFYASKQHDTHTAKSPPKPTAPVSSTKTTKVGATAKSKVEGRMAKLALLKRISKDHKQLDKVAIKGSGTYSPAMQLLRDLSTGYLMPRAQIHDLFGRASQALHEEPATKQGLEDVGHCDKCFQDAWTARHSLQCAQTWCGFQQSEAVSLADVQPAKDVKDRLTVALAHLDEEQLYLNNQRAAVFASFVGSDHGSAAHQKVAVKQFLEQWVPKGSKAVQSWLAEEQQKGDAATESKAAVLKADQLREVGAGKEGLTLEQALAPLNEQQQTINNHRQILVHAFLNAGSAFGDRKEYAKAQSMVLQWLPHTSAEAHSSSKQQQQQQQPKAAAHSQEEHAVQQSKAEGPKSRAQQQPEAKRTHTKIDGWVGPGEKASAVQQQPKMVAQPAQKPVVNAVQPVAVHPVKVVAAQKPVVNAAQPVAVQPAKVMAAQQQAGKLEQVKRAAESKTEGGESHAHDNVIADAEGRDNNAKQDAAKADAAKHHGMPQYDAKKAAEDMEGWFDDLVHKQIAVGHGVQTHVWDVKAPPTPEVSPKEKARQAEDQMIESHDSAKRAGSSLEEEEEQAKKGMLVSKVGNELQHKSDHDARDELRDYFDHLSL